jgi:hypothetical protein
VDPAKRVQRLRRKYERALAKTEARGTAYHEAVYGLLESGGPEIRKLAEELGLVDQRSRPDQPGPQTITARPSRQRRRLSPSLVAVAAALALALLVLGALRVAQAPPFVPSVRVPRVVGLRQAAAVRRLEDAGLRVRLVRYRRSIPGVLSGSVVGVSHPAGSPAAGEKVARGSTITLYIVMRRKSTKKGHS